MSAERMEELAGQASLRDAGITAGIATDKLLALSGDPILTFRHEPNHRLTDDDIVAFAVHLAKSKAVEATVIDEAESAVSEQQASVQSDSTDILALQD